MRKFICFLVILSVSACADVDKALYSVSNSVSSVDRVTGERSFNLKNRESQIRESNAEIEEIISHAKQKNIPLNEEIDKQSYQKLLKVFSRVHKVSHLRDEKWKVLLLPDESFNAFVNGGTYVVVNSGLVEQVENEDELAAIIGHEIAHVAANHSYERASLNTFAKLAGSKSTSRNTFRSAATHENEEEADAIGILYAALAGYDPFAAANLWQRMQKKRGDFSRIIVDHPIYSERSKKAAELAASYDEFYKSGEVNPKYKEILDGEVLRKTESSSLAPGKGGGIFALLEVTLDGVDKHYAAKAEELRQKTRVQQIALTERFIQIKGIEKPAENRVRILFLYRGYRPLKNLTFHAQNGEEEITSKIENVVMPNSSFSTVLEFDAPIAHDDVESLKMLISHVEWL